MQCSRKLIRPLIFAEMSDAGKQAANVKSETCRVHDVLANGRTKYTKSKQDVYCTDYNKPSVFPKDRSVLIVLGAYRRVHPQM